MGRLIAEKIKNEESKNREDCDLYSHSLVGDDVTEKCVSIWDDAWLIDLYQPKKHQVALEEYLKYCADVNAISIIIDFTQPSAVNAMAERYCQLEIPFIMGTTGGDREVLRQTVLNAAIPAIVAPNMAKHVVGLMAAIVYIKENFPGFLNGFKLIIEESHQKTKTDPSGTAKAISLDFQGMGAEEIGFYLERDPVRQTYYWGIPADYLDGHGHHKYALVNEGLGIRLEIGHHINGRNPYVDGTLDAISFLRKKIQVGETGYFTMIDVLKGA